MYGPILEVTIPPSESKFEQVQPFLESNLYGYFDRAPEDVQFEMA